MIDFALNPNPMISQAEHRIHKAFVQAQEIKYHNNSFTVGRCKIVVNHVWCYEMILGKQLGYQRAARSTILLLVREVV